MKQKVLILCHDTIGQKMAGPGIRYQNIAEQISKVANVTLAMFSDKNPSSRTDSIYVSKEGNGYKKIFDNHEIIFAQWLSADMLDYANQTNKTIIFDLYAPVPIEYLASLGFSSKTLGPEKDLEFSGILETYRQYFTSGDFFVCSNDRQRDFWTGFLTAIEAIKPSTFSESGWLERIVLCPMGISQQPPKKQDLKLRASLNIKPDDFVLLWTGGIWDWFDAGVVIKAVEQLKNPKVKLVFLGTKHPNSSYANEMDESLAARKLSAELDLTDKSVFFRDGWVPYEERASYLLDADAAIYADKESLETRFAHRTRVLDHIWTSLPTISSSGDYMAEMVDRYGFGIAVKERTAKAFAEAINKLLNDKKLYSEMVRNIEKHKADFEWTKTLSPLLDYIASSPQHRQISTAERYITQPRIKLKNRVKKAARIIIKG